jgi:hypothetical protein
MRRRPVHNNKADGNGDRSSSPRRSRYDRVERSRSYRRGLRHRPASTRLGALADSSAPRAIPLGRRLERSPRSGGRKQLLTRSKRLLAVFLGLLFFSSVTPWCCLIRHRPHHRPAVAEASSHGPAHHPQGREVPSAATTLRTGATPPCPWTLAAARGAVSGGRRNSPAILSWSFAPALATHSLFGVKPGLRPAPSPEQRTPRTSQSPPDTPPPRAV